MNLKHKSKKNNKGYATLEATEIKDMWIQELDESESQYKRLLKKKNISNL